MRSGELCPPNHHFTVPCEVPHDPPARLHTQNIGNLLREVHFEIARDGAYCDDALTALGHEVTKVS